METFGREPEGRVEVDGTGASSSSAIEKADFLGTVEGFLGKLAFLRPKLMGADMLSDE